MEAYLIIDIGTGNARVAVTNRKGAVLSIAREDVHYVKDEHYPDSIYFDPDELWEQILRLARRALAEAPGAEVVAFTATSQREGIVLLGRNGESLIGLPNIDHRGRQWEGDVKDKQRVYALSGRYPTSLFSALKLVGVREARRPLWERTAGFLSISDWVQYKLSGVRGYEHSQASETLLYDVAGKQWSRELCDMFSLDTSLLPELVSSGTVLGPLLSSLAAELAAAAGAVVVVGGADTQLAIEGTQPGAGDMVIVSGTTTPIIRLLDKYIIDKAARTWTSRHTDERSFILEANAGVTGLNYQRLKEIFYPNESYSIIEQELADTDCRQCVAVLGSLIADEPSPVTRGGFLFNVPVSHELNRASFVWATLWDIACSIRENFLTLCSVESYASDHVWACGGGMQSRALRELIAGLLNKKVLMRCNYKDSTVVGGAYICHRALHGGAIAPVEIEEVAPVEPPYFAEQYASWKQTRAGLRKIG
ncbi:MAG TPA: FGGY family carbohydrate kinase [Puia sp.]|nr:FGGY family carbohydrate kinase [Puia sp.]